MPEIQLNKEARETLARLVARHLKVELDIDIEPFDSLDLVDFLSETLGPYYYNHGLRDAQAIVQSRVDGIIEAVCDIEKPMKR